MKKIILLGAGYANLMLLKSLSKDSLKKAEFILINDNNYHYKTTELHKIASNESEKDIAIELDKILPKEVTFIKDTVLEIKPDEVICRNTSYKFDELVVGLGAANNTFGIEGLETCEFINTFSTAEQTKQKLLSNLASNEPFSKDIIICGAGFSGVELCGSIATVCKQKGIKANITLVEAMPQILPVYSAELAQKAQEYLSNLGVKVLTNTKFVKKDGDKLYLNDFEHFIQAKTIIFTAGVKGNDVMAKSCFEQRGNRVAVDEFLRDKEHKNCFIIGDCSAVMNGERPYPPTAQLACAQGEYLAERFNAVLAGKEFDKKFEYNDRGSVCSVGANYSVAHIKGKELSGLMANQLKKVTEKRWQYRLFGISAIF